MELLKELFRSTAVRILSIAACVLAAALILANAGVFERSPSEKKNEENQEQQAVSAVPVTVIRENADGGTGTAEANADPAVGAAAMSAEEDSSAAVDSMAEAVAGPVPQGEVQITISAAGDCTLAKDDGMEYDVSFNASFDEHEPGWFMAGVHDVFATDDLTIVNLECALSENGSRDEEKTYAFRGSPEYVRVLTDGSVEACNLANNHSFDYGTEAYEDTKQVLEDAGVVSFGYDRSQVITIKGIKIGLVGIYELEAGLDSMDLLLQEIEGVQDQGAQLVIVSFHWGDEGSYDVNEVQIELAHAAIDAGANLVLGHHPHRVQGVGRYNGVYIAYSLGNFVFGGNSSPEDMDCLIFRQTFTFKDGVLRDTDEHLVIPCRISSTTAYNNYQPVILEEEEADELLEKVDSLL